MEKTETAEFTKKLTNSIFSKLYQNIEPKEPKKAKRKVFKDPPAKSFQRLETDSSDEESKPSNLKTSVHIQTEENHYLQEEIRKKDLEIKQLKQILLETQEKLTKQGACEPEIKDLSSSEEVKQVDSKKPEKKFVGKFEELVFVSKKNKVMFDEENKERSFSSPKDSRNDLLKSQRKPTGIKEVESCERQESVKDIHQESDADHKLKPENQGKKGEKKGKSIKSPVSNPKHPLPGYLNKLNPGSNESASIQFKSGNVSLSRTITPSKPSHKQVTALKNPKKSPIPSLPIDTSLKSLNSCLSSIDSFHKFEAMLSNHSSPEDSNPKLSPQDSQEVLPATILKESGQSYLNQGTSTDWNDPEVKLRPNFTFDPVFQIISENFEPVAKKKSIKRSRNSSLPWIDDGFVDEKPKQKPVPQKVPKFRPKTQEKPPVARVQHVEKPKFQSFRKPQTAAFKANRVQIRPRANSHGKTKTKTKKIEKNSLRHLEKDDILDDIIFDEEQDLDTWNKLMNKFRQNPVIISRLLKSRGRPSTQEEFQKFSHTKQFEKIKHVNHIGRSSMDDKPETLSINSVIDFRPISAPEITPKPFTSNSRRVKDPDWSSSILDTYVTQKKTKFNFISDFSLLSSQDIEEHIKSLQSEQLSSEDQRQVFKKATNTLNTLKKELSLPEFWINLPPFCTESLAQSLSKCQKLMKARTLTIKAIELIHYRESLLLELMSYGKESKEKFKELEKVNEELLQVLVFWKYMELPFTSFVYLGEDYYNKIHEDNSNLASIFPQFQMENIFKGQVTNDSFNIDI